VGMLVSAVLFRRPFRWGPRQTCFRNASARSQRAEDRGQIWRKFLGASQQDAPDTYALASPLHHLDETDPACWFITGENDDASTHADRFRERMTQYGIKTELTLIKDAPHAFLSQQVWFDQMIEAADSFFTETLKQ
jgi:arylsulfatase A